MEHIYLHGLGQASTSWDETIKQLTSVEQSMCPNLADLVSENEVTYSNLYLAFSNICNDLEGVIDLCGLSLGGVLALNYTIDYPEKVNSLILIATQYKMPKKLLLFQNFIFRFMPGSMFQKMGFGKSEFICLCKTMTELDFSSSLQKVSCPTLVICGEKDAVNKKASIELANGLPNAEFHVIKGVGHEINTEAPEKLAKELQVFYDE